MAKGDQLDIERRLGSILPRGWFADTAAVLPSVQSGFAAVAAFSWTLLMFVRDQTRLATTSGVFLDLYGVDFLGLRVPRRAGQADPSYRQVVSKEILRERGTKRGIVTAVADLTSKPAAGWEPWSAFDCGGFDTGYLGFDERGRWGSIEHPWQMFVDAVQPLGAGIPGVGGFETPPGALDIAPGMYGDQALVTGPITSQDIFDTVNDTRPAGVTIWVAIGPAPPVTRRIDFDFTLDQSQLG